MRQQIEGNLIGIHLGLHVTERHQRPGLIKQFIHRCGTGAGHGLKSRHHHTFHAHGIMQRFEGHYERRRRTIGNGYNPAWKRSQRRDIHLRHHQGHLRIHPKYPTVIDHNHPGRTQPRTVLFADRIRRRDQREIDTGE